MGNSFLTGDGPLKTVMIQVRTTKEALAEIQSGLSQGADAFGLQVECLLGQERTEANLKKIFAAGAGKPFYVTDYCLDQNEGKSYDEIAEELLFLARMGAALIDIPGDFYCKDPDQLTCDENAVKKQLNLIDAIHKCGAQVLMSSHIGDFRTEDYVLGVAFEQKRRGADIAKIVTFSHDDEQLSDNLKTVVRLKETLGIPFLFLTSGEKGRLQRLAGPLLGCCMWLCVAFRAPITTQAQPLLSEINQFVDIMNSTK